MTAVNAAVRVAALLAAVALAVVPLAAGCSSGPATPKEPLYPQFKDRFTINLDAAQRACTQDAAPSVECTTVIDTLMITVDNLSNMVASQRDQTLYTDVQRHIQTVRNDHDRYAHVLGCTAPGVRNATCPSVLDQLLRDIRALVTNLETLNREEGGG
jgi:hypothetical protein